MNAQAQFVTWVKNNFPQLYQESLNRMQKQMNGLSGISDIFTSIVSTVKDVGPQFLQYQQQKKIMDIQIQRAKQNLPPLDATQYSPTFRVAPEITPETEQAMQRMVVNSASQSISNMKWWLLGGVAVMFFLFYKKR